MRAIEVTIIKYIRFSAKDKSELENKYECTKNILYVYKMSELPTHIKCILKVLVIN